MAFRKAMDKLEELDQINEGMNTHDTYTDQTNHYDIHIECQHCDSHEWQSLYWRP